MIKRISFLNNFLDSCKNATLRSWQGVPDPRRGRPARRLLRHQHQRLRPNVSGLRNPL